MKTQRRISLRYKLLTIIVALPVVFLLAYLFMATNLFYQDKKAYVYDSSVFMARSLADQTKTELTGYQRIAEPILSSVSLSTKKFSPRAISFFNAQKNIEHLLVYQRKPGTQFYSISDHIKTLNRELKEPVLAPDLLMAMQKIVLDKGFMISRLMQKNRYFLIMESHYPRKDPKHFISLAVYKATDIFEAFATPTIYKNYLISKSKFFAMKPVYVRKHQDKIKINSFDFFDTIVNQKVPEGTAEILTEDGYPTLVSFSQVGFGDLVVASVIDKKAAFAAVDNLIFKSILFFLAAVGIAALISIIASIGLANPIAKLMAATEEIGEGNFDIEVDVQSRDEFGELGNRFKAMAQKVSSLMKATAEQARMENELEMVRVVQENLFPKPQLEYQTVKIVSHFEPASECGGDWFHYSEVNGKIYMWIGDATGHGAPAALITGAAKSASSIIEVSPEITPGQALEVLNHAIESTAHGSVLMTFFLGILDVETGVLSYSNASHEFPYVIPNKKGLKKKDLIPLCDTTPGKRLGESVGSTYESGEYKLQSGDSIFFYTDGIIDLQNDRGEEFGERNFIKGILHAANSTAHAAGRVEAFKKYISDFRGNAVLVDDITLFWAHFS